MAQVPLDESVSALGKLQSEGKIRHIGLSNVSVNELCRAQRIAPIVSVQNRYNFSDRSSEDVLAECEKGGLAFLPWHPLAAGGDANVAQIFVSGAWPTETGLAGWACRTRTQKRRRKLSL